ncbi:hypothetical protein MARVELLAND_83 [Bacillus phage vB_BspM_MarvelLand]|nr:hypothetical protein MARVELLAND_83 [Bacillus phage vB_BspM_MarvelLand]
MKHFLCISTKGTDTIHYFIQGKVYSASQGKDPHYMIFTDEYGDKHPIDIFKLGYFFKEVIVEEKKDITLADKQAFVEEKIRGYKKLRATGAFTLQGINNANRAIEVGEALLKDLKQLEKEQTNTVEKVIMSVKRYEELIKHLDHFKHLGKVDADAHKWVRAIITSAYRGKVD